MKIGFCFLLTFDFATEQVWELFFVGIDSSQYAIIIHGKPNLYLGTDFFQEHAQIVECIDTKWGCISLCKATNLMLHYATETIDCDFCILLSGNCIPIKSFDHIYSDLDSLPISRFYLEKSYHPILSVKQSQWCVLSLEHIQIILKYRQKYLQYFEDIHFTKVNTLAGSPDEFFYITVLIGQNITNYLSSGSTFTKWDSLTHCGHPKSYSIISRKQLISLEESHYFFIRKIMKDCKIQEYDNSLTSINKYQPQKSFGTTMCKDIEMTTLLCNMKTK